MAEREAASNGAADPRDGGGLEHLRIIGTRLADDLRGAALAILEEQKAAAAGEVEGFAAVLRRAAPPIDRAAGSAVADCADHAASRLRNVAGTMRQRRFGDIADDIADFARRRPTVFVLAALAGGIAAGRALLASQTRGAGERAPFPRMVPPVRRVGRFDAAGGGD